MLDGVTSQRQAGAADAESATEPEPSNATPGNVTAALSALTLLVDLQRGQQDDAGPVVSGRAARHDESHHHKERADGQELSQVGHKEGSHNRRDGVAEDESAHSHKEKDGAKSGVLGQERDSAHNRDLDTPVDGMRKHSHKEKGDSHRDSAHRGTIDLDSVPDGHKERGDAHHRERDRESSEEPLVVSIERWVRLPGCVVN